MQIPDYAQILIVTELRKLAESSKYFISPDKEAEICAALGYASVNKRMVVGEASRNNAIHSLTTTSRIWAQLALITAKKVVPLWRIACQETELYFTEQDWQDNYENQRKEEDYLNNRNALPIEKISAYDVPRAFIPSHILEMAESALAGNIHDFPSFQHEASEWWEFYGRPEQMEREFCIKWAAQDALYAALGWLRYDPDPPITNALYAFAGVFKGDGLRKDRESLDENKQHEFWIWWLSRAIPQAFAEDRHQNS